MQISIVLSIINFSDIELDTPLEEIIGCGEQKRWKVMFFAFPHPVIIKDPV